MIILSLLVSFAAAFLGILILIPRLERTKIVGKDMHKPGQPEVPEMGGLAIVAALPLMAVRVGHTMMKIPFIGTVDFWIFYPLVLVPNSHLFSSATPRRS